MHVFTNTAKYLIEGIADEFSTLNGQPSVENPIMQQYFYLDEDFDGASSINGTRTPTHGWNTVKTISSWTLTGW